MSWRDQLRPASWKDFEFQYDDAEDRAPRRWVAHESAAADGASHENMKLGAREVRFTAYLIGDDHIDQANAFIKLLQSDSAGTLVHPWFGSLWVICDDWSVRHTTREGGVSAFQLTFRVDNDRAARPVATVDRASTVATAQVAALTTVSSAFETAFTVDDQPGWVVDDSVDLVSQLADGAEGVLAPLTDGLDGAQDLADTLTGLRADVTGLLATPADLADGLLGLIVPSGLTALASTVAGLLGLSLDFDLLDLLGLDGWWDDEDAASWSSTGSATPSRVVQSTNREALSDLWSSAVAIQAATLATAVDYDNSTEVIATRDQVLSALDAVLESTADDSVFASVYNLRAEVADTLATEALQAPRLVDYTPAATLPALVIANSLYGADATTVVDQAEAIVTRNAIAHPGAVPGGETLEVLAS